MKIMAIGTMVVAALLMNASAAQAQSTPGPAVKKADSDALCLIGLAELAGNTRRPPPTDQEGKEAAARWASAVHYYVGVIHTRYALATVPQVLREANNKYDKLGPKEESDMLFECLKTESDAGQAIGAAIGG